METIEIIKNFKITDYYNNEDLTEKEMMELCTLIAKNVETETCWKKINIDTIAVDEWYETDIWDHMTIKAEATYYGEPGMYSSPNDKAYNCSFVFELRFEQGRLDVVRMTHYWGSEQETMWGRAKHRKKYFNYGNEWKEEDEW